ncbi:MAG TPA: transposase [Thermomicrobiales bacterium]|nr:transposase [Thermomicrobiales bacterium]
MTVAADEGLAGDVVVAVAERCVARGASLELFCLMPDHLHLLVRVGAVGLVEVVGDVKSRTTRGWWAHGGNGALWQRSFHDHGIRGGRDFDETVRYIVENPVKAGLVEDWREYPFTGGALIEEGQ